MRTLLKITLLIGGSLNAVSATLAQTPLTKAFTYQGRLNENGQPANGVYDLRFSLWRHPTASDNGDAVGGIVTINDVVVSDGLFTVELSGFSANPFDGNQRWLELRVRDGDAIPAPIYTTLSPRQQLTAAPHASYALQTPWSGLTGVPAGFADGVDNTAGSLDQAYDFGGAGLGRVVTADAGAVNLSGSADASLTTDGLLMLGDSAGPNVILDRNEIMARNNGQLAALSLNADGGDVAFVQNGLGNVGIGTSSPAQKLSVVGTVQSTSGGFMFPDGSLQTTASGSSLWAASGSTIHSTNSGNVGIGTNSPDMKLEVRGSVGSGSSFASVDAWVYLRSLTTGNQFAWDDLVPLIFGTTATPNGTITERMRIESDGKVGIGTPAPERKLHVSGDAVLFERATNDAAVLLRNTSAGTLNASFGLKSVGSNNGYAYLTDEDQSPTLFLWGGKVGISDSTPDAKLDIFNDGNAACVLLRNTNPSNVETMVDVVNEGDGAVGFFGLANSSSTEAALEGTTLGEGDGVFGNSNAANEDFTEQRAGVRGRNQSDGPGVFGTSDDGSGVMGYTGGSTLRNDAGVYGYGNGGLGLVGESVLNDGIYGAIYNFTGYAGFFLEDVIADNYFQFSDATYKENIQTCDDAIETVSKLRGVYYDIKPEFTESNHWRPVRRCGFVAQEVREVLPDIVRENRDGKLAVSYVSIIPLLTESIKEQQGRIELLQAENDALRTANDALKGRVDQIAQQVAALSVQR